MAAAGLGLGAGAAGTATALYEQPQLDVQDLGAQSGEAGGQQLTSMDPEEARFNRILGRVNVVLGILDMGLEVGALSRLIKQPRAMSTLSKLQPEQLARFDEATKLRQSGQVDEAQEILTQLRRELGDEVVDQVDDLLGLKLGTGAEPGLDPTPETIRVGTVRMQDHPNYERLIREAEDQGYQIVFVDKDPHVVYREVVDRNGQVIGIEKELHLVQDMRYLDLEHEMGHINQLKRFGDSPPPTERLYERPNGVRVDAPNQQGTLKKGENAFTEYHNRLDEFMRLYHRGADREILQGHAEELRKWQGRYRQALRKGRNKDLIQWAEQYFPDTADLYKQFLAATEEMGL